MCDVSDPNIASAYQEIRTDSNETNWFVWSLVARLSPSSALSWSHLFFLPIHVPHTHPSLSFLLCLFVCLSDGSFVSIVSFHWNARVALGYEGNAKIVLQGKGSGGLSELTSEFKDDQCQYAYLRVISGDSESRRTKFVFISWCGEQVGALKRAKMSVHKASVKTVIKVSVTLPNSR